MPARVRELAEDVWELVQQLAAEAATRPRVRRRSTPRASATARCTREAEAIAQSSIVRRQAARRRAAAPPRGARAAVAARAHRAPDPGAVPAPAARRARDLACAARSPADAVPQISVVVPIYNVEEFLGAVPGLGRSRRPSRTSRCVMVDDGSTDSQRRDRRSAYAERDPRFRLVTQAERRPERARATPAPARRRRVPRVPRLRRRAAAERLRAAARRARADRLGLRDRQRAPAHALGHRASRRSSRARSPRRGSKTHVTQLPAAARRPDGVEQALAALVLGRARLPFPEGRLYEDIPVIIPAHFLAKSVDVISDPVYFWRIREGGDLSITQRRLEPQALIDRLQAIEEVSDHLERARPARRQALVRRERRRRRPALLRQRARRRRRRLPRSCSWTASTRSWTARARASTSRCRRSSGSSGTSSGAG